MDVDTTCAKEEDGGQAKDSTLHYYSSSAERGIAKKRESIARNGKMSDEREYDPAGVTPGRTDLNKPLSRAKVNR